MADSWVTMTAQDVRVGDRIRNSSHELLVTRIDDRLMDREGLFAFVEDSPERWFKLPSLGTSEFEVLRP